MELLFTYYPLGTINFFRKVICFGFFGGLLMSIPVTILLYLTWSSLLFTDRVLRVYHLVRLFLFLLQAPCRLYMYRKLSEARERGDRRQVVEAVLALCKTKIWRANQVTGVMVYWLFAFALVFCISARHAATISPLLYRVCVMNVVVFVLHMFFSCIWLRSIILEDAFEAAMWKRGTTKIGLETFTQCGAFKGIRVQSSHTSRSSSSSSTSSSAELSESSNSALNSVDVLYETDNGMVLKQCDCSICMCDYSCGDSVRMLPCGHHYHDRCVTPWLLTKKACPLCLRDIDDPTNTNQSIQQQHRHLQSNENGNGIRHRLTSSISGIGSSGNASQIALAANGRT